LSWVAAPALAASAIFLISALPVGAASAQGGPSTITTQASTSPPESVMVSPNQRLGSGGPALRGADFPGLAVDPANPNHIVEVDEDLIAGTCAYHVSFDGGATWTGGTISAPAGFESPPCQKFDIGGYGHMDASVAFGSGGNVYTTFSSQSSPTANTQSVLVARSSDGGRSFQTATVALRSGADGLASFQRPQLAVEPHAGGDRVYVDAWGGIVTGKNFGSSRSSIPGCGQPCGFKIVMATSDTSGSTWSAPEAVSAPTKPAKAALDAPVGITREQSRPEVAPNGDIYVAWVSLASAKSGNELVVGRSRDGGATWSPVVVGGAGHTTSGLSAPSLALGPNGAIFVAYQLRTSKGLRDIRVVHSSDQGTTWSPPVRVVDRANVGNAGLPQLAVAHNGRVDVLWYDFRNSPGSSMTLMDVYMASSTDGGNTFSANRRITDRSIDYATGLYSRVLERYFYTPALATMGDSTDLVAWPDSRLGKVTNATQDIFDAKVSFNPSGPIPVDTLGTPAPPSTPEQASVALSQLAYPGGQETAGSKVVIVNVDDPAAALAGAVLARADFGPVLLTKASGLTKGVEDEIRRLSPAGAYLVGTDSELPAKVSAQVEAAGVGASHVVSIRGPNPASMAAQVAAILDTRTPAQRSADSPAFPAAVVTNPTSPEAPTASAFAAALGLPVLFVNTTSVPSQTLGALRSLDITTTLIVGDPSQVSAGVLASLPSPHRFKGTDPASVSEAIATAARSSGIPTNVIYVVSDTSPVIAGVAGAAVGRLGGLLLVTPSTASAEADLATAKLDSQVDRIVLIPGGATSGGLGTGALVGIAIGAALVLSALILLALGWSRRTRRA
jgi:hypothetical protein